MPPYMLAAMKNCPQAASSVPGGGHEVCLATAIKDAHRRPDETHSDEGRNPPKPLGAATIVRRPRANTRAGESAKAKGPSRSLTRLHGRVVISVATPRPCTDA